MLRRVVLSALVVASLVSGLGLPTSAQAQTPKTKILFLTESKGFVHGSVNRNVKDGQKKDLAASEVAMTQLGQQTGLFSIHCTQDSKADFTKENLKNYDLVMFYTTGELSITDEARDYFMNDWLKQKGQIGRAHV